MRRNINSLLGVLFSAAILSSCSDNHDGPQELRSEMTFTFSHPSQTRATDTAFEQGDQVGLYLVNDGNTFEISGNHLNNERITFAGSGTATVSSIGTKAHTMPMPTSRGSTK